MLPPQTSSLMTARRHSLVLTSSLPLRASAYQTVRATSAHVQIRSLWRWRSHIDYTSELDPQYHRCNRYRTMKTRARLIDKLKRRSKFLWDDSNDRPFFTPKHIRFASHSNGIRGPRWPRMDAEEQEDPTQKRKDEEEGEDGYELSAREKEWKGRMEFMRKRIESDPYEAVFGKRFEPFWSPLVPSWMREEMGLQGWPKEKEDVSKPIMPDLMKKADVGPDLAALKEQLLSRMTAEKDAQSAPKTAEVEPVPQKQSHSSYTATSWDSRTNKTRRTEWDSTSGQLKRFEYDPVSNRMVEVVAPPVAENGEVPRVEQARTGIVSSPPSALETRRAGDMRSLINSPAKEVKSVDIPIKKSFAMEAKETETKVAPSEQRLVSVGFAPPPDDSGSRKSRLDDLMNTLATETKQPATAEPPRSRQMSFKEIADRLNDKPSLQTLKSGLQSSLQRAAASSTEKVTPASSLCYPTAEVWQRNKPAALAMLPKHDEDMLSADDVRAKMGKLKDFATPKPSTVEEKAALESKFEESAAEWDKAEESVMLEKELENQLRSLRRKKSKLLHDEHGLFHIERQKREIAKLDGRILEVRARMEKAMGIEKAQQTAAKTVEEVSKLQASASPLADLTRQGYSVSWKQIADVLPRPRVGNEVQKVITRLQTSLDRAAPTRKEVTATSVLQPAVDRLQSKDLPKAIDLDDAAAHESTEPIEIPSSVPKQWSNAAELLQADRIKRTTAKKPFPSTVRWIDHMQARKAAYEAAKAPSAEQQAAEKEKSSKLEKANALLEAEVKEQKFRMQSHENRYAHKIRSLRQELETAYKQSAVHSDKHVERIRFLEAELAKTSKAAGGEEVKESQCPSAAEMQGEGDFSPGIAKFADSARWYKQAAPFAPKPKLSRREVEKAEQKARDQALVKEVREIYEREYGVIDTEHRQPVEDVKVAADSGPKKQVLKAKQVVEVESDVDLGEALAEHERAQGVTYAYKDDGLEAEIQAREREAREREAHEVQAALMQPENAAKMERVIASNLKQVLAGRKKVDPVVPQPAALGEEAPAQIGHGVQWEEPPVYKVLAYDSGNDMFSTATTTANFTGTETPISIPQALSQLYQPARFVSHFAELQQEGWQVIHGTRDLLVFRKVKAATAKADEPAAPVTAAKEEAGEFEVGLVDHGLIKPKENELAQEAANFYDKYKPAPQPYDPTSIENGKLMPYENAMAQEAANAYDAMRTPSINPIDGTTRTTPATEVSTGNFASPTGFVNHDRTFLDDSTNSNATANNVAKAMNRKETISSPEDVDYIHYPRVHRQEPVYSGGSLPASRKRNDRQARQEAKRQQKYWDQQEARRRFTMRMLLWTLGLSSVLTVGVAGLVAQMAMLSREEKQKRVLPKERWEEILEGRRGRWE